MATPGYEQNPLPPEGKQAKATGKRSKLSQKDKLRRYQYDVALAERVMEPVHKKWRRYIEFYKGNQWLLENNESIEPKDAVTVNMIASVVNTVLPAVTTQPPKLRAIAMREQDMDAAPFVEAMLQWDWERLKVKNELVLATEDMLITGIGWTKTGYEFETRTIDRDPDEVEQEVQQLLAKQAAQLAGEEPTGVGAAGGPELLQQEQPSPPYGQGYGPGLSPNPEGQPDFGSVPQQGAMPQGGVPGELRGQDVLPEEAQALGMAQGVGGDEAALAAEQDQVTSEELAGQLEQEGTAVPEGLDAAYPQAAPQDPSQAALLSEDEIRALVAQTEDLIVRDDIFVERVSPFEVFVDPEARSLDEARWIAQRVIRPLEDVQADPKLSNTAKLKATEESRVAGTARARELATGKDDLGDYTKRVVLWEYYNLKERTLCIFAEGYDKFLFEGDYDYPFEDSPFDMVEDYHVPDELFGFGEVEMIAGPQVELNKLRTSQLVHTKRARRKHLYRREAFDPDGISALESDVDGVMVPVAHGQSLAEAVQPIPENAISMPTDWYQMSNVVENDLTVLSGVSDYQRGAFLPRHVTASEANLMQAAQDLRARDKLDRIEELASKIGYKMKSLAQQYYDQQRQMVIKGNGVTVPVSFDKTNIEGDFDVKVDASSTQPTNEVFRQQQAERMYQLLRPDPLLKGEELIKEVLRAYGIYAPERFILSPEEQMLQQLQAAMGGQPGAEPSATGTQPGQAEGNVEGGADQAAAVAGGQEAAIP